MAPIKGKSFANLHLHTFFSDGVISPARLVEAVYQEEGLEAFALTDHDTMSGIEPVYRLQKEIASRQNVPLKKFLSGVEISLREEQTDQIVHLIGFFPWITHENYQTELGTIEEVLGDFCRHRSRQRGVKDMDFRIHKAHRLNLDGLGDRYDTAEEIIERLRLKSEQINSERFKEAEKEKDLIQHPIPVTYQVIIDTWEELLPASSREKIILYILRPAPRLQERLAQLFVQEGMPESEAHTLATAHQGVLSKFEGPIIKDKDILEGLSLLKLTGAVTIICHPAVNHERISYKDFDHHILQPLIENGLDGIEVFYPYDMSYRSEAFLHYENIAQANGLLISGGTDFHGDGRVGLSDVRLSMEQAGRIIHHHG